MVKELLSLKDATSCYLCAFFYHVIHSLLRAVRGTGKSDREGFYAAALWFHQHHPKTLASNVPSLADLATSKIFLKSFTVFSKVLQFAKHRKKSGVKGNQDPKTNVVPQDQPVLVLEKQIFEQEKQIENKDTQTVRTTNGGMAYKLVQRYTSDPNFKFLHDSISDHFADCLKNDLQFLKSGSPTKISLAAKWCPSVDSSFDRSTLLCESIAKRIFPREEYEGVEEAHYAYRVRDRLRKDVLVPLRKDKFLKHDKERFEKYLDDVKSGKTTIAASGALLPHEIIGSLGDRDGGEVGELQWKRMVDDLLKKGKMRNCLAVCDVSRSMSGIPIEISVALGLLVSELCDEPWKGKVITFSAEPKLHVIQGHDLKSKVKFVKRMEWGMNTDFQKVFDRILDVAVNGNLKEDQMIKRIFVFSDMEFDEASTNSWETDYQAITRKYREKGYGSAVPQMVFWNLRDSKATQKGVALVSGFSKNLLTLFLDNEGDISPVKAMEAAIAGPEYQKLVVLD
ncbi:hypothetical protein P8452_46350 [Trifolium repens]|nr:hypothetical protein P8452_46350 [Trifolium repens]